MDTLTTSALGDALCHILGNTCRLSRTAMSYQWNVRGQDARGLASCLREQAEELHNCLDSIAEHIRGLGLPAVLDYSDVVVELNPPDKEFLPSQAEMISNLIAGHDQACFSLIAALDMSSEYGDHGTTQLLALRLNMHRRHKWQLEMNTEYSSERFKTN